MIHRTAGEGVGRERVHHSAHHLVMTGLKSETTKNLKF